MNNFEDFKYIKGFGGGGGASQAPAPTSAYEDVEGFVYDGLAYNVYQFAKVKDLLSEGPIGGLLEGQYLFSGQAGDLGFKKVTYNEYPSVVGSDGESKYLRSVQWNQTPLLDSQDKYNFQQINIQVTNGTPVGTSSGGEFDNVSYIRSIGERLRGPNQLATTEDDVLDYQRTYRILNRECKKMSLIFRVSSLYVALKYQDLEAVEKGLKIEGVTAANKTNGNFTLDPSTREVELTDGKTLDAGVGSVIRHNFKIRIRISPIYKEGYNGNSATIPLTSDKVKVVNDAKDLVVNVDSFPQVFEIESKGKVTQGYAKQVVFDTSSKFLSLNENENWLGWDISVLKISPEDTYSSRVSFISLESITEIYSSSFRYTNSAIVTSKFNAAYFSKIPERSYDVKLLKVKVPANYDPVTKTYGNTTPLSITETNSFKKTDKVITTDFFIGENNSYANSDNVNPPITDGLIAQFDASNPSLTTSTGAVTSWPNTVAGSTIKCILGDGTYASPAGTTARPTYGSSYSEQSPNGNYGVSFTTSQKVRFVYQTETASFSDANNNYTIFTVCKWHDSATSAERNKIISSSTAPSSFVLGFDAKFNSTFVIGAQVYGVMPINFYQFNRSNYWDTSNDANTYIAGTSVNNLKDINIFWQNTNYYAKPVYAVAAPKGLAINSAGATSRCTVFEILVFNKALSKSDGIKIRNWLNNKWNVTRNSISTTTTSGSYNTNVLNVGASTYLKMPLKTLCANGQSTKAYSYAGGNLASSDYYQFDLIPQRYWKNSSVPSNFSLKDQGFCSFYSDFFIKLSASISNGNYTLIHRDNQFNLSMTISGENVSLILTIISSNDGKKYTITKALDSTKYSTTRLKDAFTRISFYALPKVVKPNISYNANAAKVTNINISDRTWTNDYFTVRRVTADGGEKALALELKDFYLIKSITFKEDASYSSEINNLPETCYKYIYCNFNSASVNIGQQKFPNYIAGIERRLTKEYFPDILNAEIDVLVNLEKQIQCNINIANYSSYQTLCVGALWRPNSDATFQNEINQRVQISAISQAALDSYNKLGAHKTFDGSSTSITLDSSQEQVKVLIPLAAGQIYDAANTKTGPFIPSYFITNNNQIEIFTDKSGAGFGGKIQGFADSIRVNQIDFDRLSLTQAFARNLFSEGLSRKTVVYDVAGVLPYSTSNDYWDGEFKTNKEWTDNPAWCFYDLLTNKRYGVGNYVTENDVDKWSLYQIAKYCDELVSDGFGGVEPRFTCNLYIQSQDDALKVLSDMASVFRGMFYYSNGFIYAINDMPEETPIYSFTNSNVVDGNFNYESTSLKDRNSAVYVRYIDKNNFYKPAVEYVENIEAVRKFGFKETELTAFGCTSRGQAQRLGRWLLASEYNETETVSFESGPECVYLKPGDVIKVYDYNRKYKTVGGRLNNINISGGVNATTGILALDRKLDFNFSGNQSYKLTILSPKYNLDPSFAGAVNSNIDYNEYRQPLTNSFIINSGNLITGQYYDSIRITGLAPVMASGLNVTGLSYFTGASGMSPKSITWALENSGNLNGSTDSDYDFYRVFRIQESTEGSSYTVMGSQMYHLKYAQIESGLNITPAKAPAPEASAPLRALFTLGVTESNGVIDQSKVSVEIFYDSSIKETTIGFKIFNKAFYGSDFNPNSSSDFTFVPIDIYESYVRTVLDKEKIKGSIRIYGTNINNSSPLSYVEASSSDNSSETFVSPIIAITYDDVNTSSSVTVNNKAYSFRSPITLTRSEYFQSSIPSQVQSIKPSESLLFNIPLQFIKNPNKFNNLDYPYRIVIIPEKVNTKESFITSYDKYLNSSTSWEEYLTFDEDSTNDNIYNYKTSNVLGRYRDFSLAIDKRTFTDSGMKSTSNEFKNADGFLLVTYDNQDADLKGSLNAILNDTRATYSIVTSQGSNRLRFTVQQDSASSFINAFYLLLIPTDSTFKFGVNSINHNSDGTPLSINDATGKEIIDSHFVTIPNNQAIFNFNDLSDDNGKGFDSTSYNAYLIAVDSLMFAWQFNSNAATVRNILDYYSSFIDKDSIQGKNYAQISDPIIIKQESSNPLSFSLESVLKDADTRYLHFTFNKTILTESTFETSVNTLRSPNYAISRKSVIYKPTTNANLSAGGKDDKVLSSDPDGTMAYYKLSLQNRDNIPNASISPKIPTGKRAYVLNGNKIFTRALVADPAAPVQLLKGVESELVTSNVFKSKGKITNSSFGEGGEEFFDISITRLNNSTFTGNIKSLIPDNANTYLIPVNASTSNTEASAKSVFNNVLNDGLLNSSFNAINVTPENNFSELGVSTKSVEIFINREPKDFTVYAVNQQTTNSLSNGIATLFYAGVPVLENESLSVSFAIGNVNKTKAIKVYCFAGEDFIASEVDKTQIIPGDDNIIKVTLKNVPYANYYTYINSYAATASITNPYFWKFKSPKNLAFAHLNFKNQFPLYNFHIQALELSIVITY